MDIPEISLNEWFEFRTGRRVMLGGCWGNQNGTFFDLYWPAYTDREGDTVFDSEVRPWRNVIAWILSGRIKQIEKKIARQRQEQLTLWS